MLPAASVAVTLIVCRPGPATVHAAGLWLRLIEFVPLQLSLAVTPVSRSGTVAWQFASAEAPSTAGQISPGTALLVTVKAVVQVPLLPAASVAVTVIVC